MSGGGRMKWALAMAALVAGALAVVLVGTFATAPAGQSAPDVVSSGGEGQQQSQQESGTAALKAYPAGSVPAYEADPEGFAEALAAYTRASEIEATSCRVVSDPEDPQKSAYALCAGKWLSCEAVGGVAGWAFAEVASPPASALAALSSEERGSTSAPEASSSSASTEPAGQESPSSASQPSETSSSSASAQASQGSSDARRVMLTDSEALADMLGSRCAASLGEAMSGYCASKGIAFERATSWVDPSTATRTGEEAHFVAHAGDVALDVIYDGKAYGFLVL